MTLVAALDSITRIETGNDDLEIVLVQTEDAPLRIARWGARGATADAPPGQAAVEILTVDAGHAPSTSRLTSGLVSSRLRYVSHETVPVAGRPGWVRTDISLVEDATAVAMPLHAVLHLEIPPRGLAARSSVTLTARGSGPARVVQSVASVALRVSFGVDAVTSPDALRLASADSDWIGESRWKVRGLREAGLADLRLASHETGARGSLSFASEGTWSTSRGLPTGVLEAPGAGALAWQIEHNGGWRWELGEDFQGTSLALSGPTDSDHQWLALLDDGQSFTTVPATLAAGADLEGAVAALTDFRRAARRAHPDDRALGVVFNDYMNTLMGDPTTEKLLPLIDAAAEVGAQYFMIDAGWYDDSGDWWYSVGDWQPSTVRFPGGLAAVIQRIRDRDMIPGLWLEPEVVGVDSPAADRLPFDAFLSRRGVRIVEHGRYHLDLRHPAAVAHLDAVVDRLVTDLGVGYFKLDYNINPGAGTDVDSVSPGAGLLDHNRAHLAWLESVLDRHPDLVLENCGSGAMRMDQAMLSRLQLQSTSDQQDPEAYPPIAAAAPLMMLPEQAANWAYPQPGMDDEALAFTLCTAILGRFYLSGHVDTMTVSQTTLVAEAVAAHKRIRHALATGHASWPLGIEQWSAPWIALAIGSSDTRYLTLWRRAGSLARIEIPLPDLVGREIVVDTVFPTRLEPWQVRWDAATGILRVTATGGEIAARTFRISTEAPAVHVQIDASLTTGRVHGGATGMLYGLGDVGVPSQALVSGVRPRTMAQKAPGGAQHPGGDAVELADGFFAAGGSEMVVYLQDALRQWPYEEVGIELYADIVRDLVQRVLPRPDRDRFVWVPFNEGDWIWYSDWSDSGRDRFLRDWEHIVRTIRAVDPAARIAGPNESHYYPDRLRDFLTFARDHGVLPDVMSWHELQPSSLEVYPAHYAHYRALEQDLGIAAIPINIDEYGNKRDMSNPAQLVQWIEMFESTKVDADLAYWTMAGNLDDHAVGTHQANAGWWLLHWYAELAGTTVAATAPHAGVRDSVRALAAVDGSVLRVIVGGTSDPVRLSLRGLPSQAIGTRITVSRVTWSGYEGDAQAPDVISDLSVSSADADGVIDVIVPGGDAMAASLVVVSPDGRGSIAPPAPWTTSVDVSDADLVGAEVRRNGDDPQEYTGAGRFVVAGLPHPFSSVGFTVSVPEVGEYRLGLFYGTEARPARVVLVVDDRVGFPVDLPATLSRSYAGRVDVLVTLTAGDHRLVIRGSGPGDPEAGHDVSVQRITLTASGADGTHRYDSLSARLAGGAVPTFDPALVTRGAAAIDLGPGSASFFVATRRRGAHRLHWQATGDVDVALDGRLLTETALGGDSATVVLPLGVTEVRFTGRNSDRAAPGSVVLTSVDVTESTTEDGYTAPVGERSTSDGDPVVIPLTGIAAGEHLLTIEYANAARATGHIYNADVITRFVDVRIDDEPEITVPLRFTNSWESLREISVPITILGESPQRITLQTTSPSDDGPRLGAVTLQRREVDA